MTEKQTTAGEILRMIENVSPDDAARLDEIDARTHIMLELDEALLKRLKGNKEKCLETYRVYPSLVPKYTRDRNALKEIRPDGVWSFLTQSGDRGIYCNIVIDADVSFSCSLAATEELAELHVIIQSIAHERSQP